MEAKFIEFEQDWANEATRYWFSVDDTEVCIVESCGTYDVLDSRGAPMLESDRKNELARLCIVTDEMRRQVAGI